MACIGWHDDGMGDNGYRVGRNKLKSVVDEKFFNKSKKRPAGLKRLGLMSYK